MVATRPRVIDEDAPLVPGELDGITLEEFLALPEATPALEYEEGRVTQKVAPMGVHSRLQSKLWERLNQITEPARTAIALTELRTTYPGARRSFVPDIALYRWERIPRTADGEIANRFTEPPDLAVEIVSPEQSVTSLVRKCVWFVEHGVRAALLVDPDDRTIMVFSADQAMAVVRGPDSIDLSDIVADLRLTADEVFGALRLD